MSKKAIITGVTGQDGSYLADLLLEKDYIVVGLHRRCSSNNFSRINHLIDKPNFILEEFDITDPSGCSRVIDQHKPDEVYNLAAQSHVGTSFSQPLTTFSINTLGVTNLLEAIRLLSPSTKFYQASTSEMFGRNYSVNENHTKFQNELTAMLPQSPYGASKLASHHMVYIYRTSYSLYACSGILFNHESPRRGENFVTRKITKYIGQLVNNKIDKNEKLKLGNIRAKRDWGHAKDYVYGMYLMLQKQEPDDYILSTGHTYSVEEFLNKAFSLVNLNYLDHIAIDPAFYRPCEVDYLKGDSSKAKNKLNWQPLISFDALVEDMVSSDIRVYKNAS